MLFAISGTPILRNGALFELPGITIEVAQECSGIRSSWVLFITTLAASYLFLRSGWKRAVLIAFVIPLAIVRNALRIWVIGLLAKERSFQDQSADSAGQERLAERKHDRLSWMK
jgi:exosortase